MPWLVVAASIIIGYQAVVPPDPIGSATATDFSSARAFEHIEAIATAPHPMGSEANAEVRRYLVETLDAMGIEAKTQTVTAPDYFGTDAAVDVVNITARIPGAMSTGTIALVAHYDTVPTTPGANDNTAAVAALLETAGALKADVELDNDVLLLFTDAEEPAPRYGATAFVAESPEFADIALVVNLEAIGGSGPSILVEINGPERWLISELGKADSSPAAFSALTATTRLLGDIGTDFDEFRNAGVAGMHFAYMRGSPIYHTPYDDIDSVGLGSLQHHGQHALGIARHFGMLDLATLRDSGSSVYFPVRPLFVSYSHPIAALLATITVAGLGYVMWRRFWQQPRTEPGSSRAIAIAVFIGSLAFATIAWVLIADFRPRMGILEGYLYFAALVTAVTVATGWRNKTNRHRPTPAALLPWLLLTGVTAVIGVGFSYLFVWPALAAAIALRWQADSRNRVQIRLAAVSLTTLIVMVPMIDTLLHLAYPRPGNPDSNLPAAVVLPLLFAVMVAHLLRAFWPATDPAGSLE